MEQQHISDLELKTALRSSGCQHVEDVSLAILETNGHVSIFKTGAREQGHPRKPENL
jgi:uncharacterized membrane protein YcaP (DUF421 family)